MTNWEEVAIYLSYKLEAEKEYCSECPKFVPDKYSEDKTNCIFAFGCNESWLQHAVNICK